MWATRNLSLALAACVVAGTALGQSKATVTEQDIERARRAQPVITDADIERARKANRMPSEQELSRVPIPSTNIDALPRPLSNRTIDLEALAKGYENAGGPTVPNRSEGPALLVFVSFAVPDATLRRLVDQAARAQAVLVLRGFVNGSLKETVAKVQQLIGSRSVAFQIDPQAFARFSVEASPTFVLLRAGAAGTECSVGTCFASDAFASVAGDVSLDYALEHIAGASPAIGKDAQIFLQRLRGGR